MSVIPASFRILSTRVPARFVRCQKAVAAVEFAIIAPFMVLLWLGAVELAFMLSADRKVTVAASTLGDLTARMDEVHTNDVADIFAATDFIMGTDGGGNRGKLRLTSLWADENGTVTVVWSEGRGQTAYSRGTTIDVPSGLIQNNSGLIMAEIEHNYDSGLDFMVGDNFTLDDRFFLRPRRSEEVVLQRGSCEISFSDPCG